MKKKPLISHFPIFWVSSQSPSPDTSTMIYSSLFTYITIYLTIYPPILTFWCYLYFYLSFYISLSFVGLPTSHPFCMQGIIWEAHCLQNKNGDPSEYFPYHGLTFNPLCLFFFLHNTAPPPPSIHNTISHSLWF